MKEFIKKNKYNIVLMIIYSVISFIILLFHESWRDEAQAWLIARDLNIIGIIKQMVYEAHPPLWHIILMPFAKLGFPYITIKIISWLITCISVWLILIKSPFNKLTKILIIFSTPMIYLYPAIARSYCLIPLAITLISIYYNKRHEKPIQYILSILLLGYTHVVLYGMVGILLLLFYIEELIINRKINDKKQKNKIWISLIIITIGLLIAAVPMILSLRINTEASVNINFSNLEFFTKFNGAMGLIIYKLFYTLEYSLILIMMTIIYGLFIYELLYYKKNALIIGCTVLFQILIYSYIYGCNDQRGGIILLLIMFIFWIQKEKSTENKSKKIIEIIIISIFIINIIMGQKIIINDIKNKYSAAQQTAVYINTNIEKNSVFICSDMSFSSAIIPYVNHYKFWSPQIQNHFTFVTYDENYRKGYLFDINSFKNKIKKDYGDDIKIYFIYVYNWEDKNIKYLEDENIINKKFESDKSQTEKYVIYSIQ